MRCEEVIGALQLACAGESDGRLLLQTPFRDGEYMVGTDGKIAVRFKIPEGEGDLYPMAREGTPSTGHVFTMDGEGIGSKKELQLGEGDMASLTELKDFWDKSAEATMKNDRNPDGLPVYKCPCCGARLYDDRGELVDSEEYDESLLRRRGFVFILPGGAMRYISGVSLSKIVGCSSALGGIKKAIIVSVADFSTFLTLSGDGWEGVAMMGPWDKFDRYRHCIKEVKIVGSQEN